MTVKELIQKLLDCDINKSVSIEYPISNKRELSGNYYRYELAENFYVVEFDRGVVIGIEQ